MSVYTGQIGQIIRVRVTDDMEVKGVSVAIRDQGGVALEQGAATWSPASATWAYHHDDGLDGRPERFD